MTPESTNERPPFGDVSAPISDEERALLEELRQPPGEIVDAREVDGRWTIFTIEKPSGERHCVASSIEPTIPEEGWQEIEKMRSKSAHD